MLPKIIVKYVNVLISVVPKWIILCTDRDNMAIDVYTVVILLYSNIRVALALYRTSQITYSDEFRAHSVRKRNNGLYTHVHISRWYRHFTYAFYVIISSQRLQSTDDLGLQFCEWKQKLANCRNPGVFPTRTTHRALHATRLTIS